MLSLLHLVSTVSAFAAVTTTAYDPATLSCDVLLTAPATNRRVIGDLADVGLPTEDVVAYVPLTPDELLTLAATGRVAFDHGGRRASEIGAHPAVARILRSFDADAAISDASFAHAEAVQEAWNQSVTALLAERARAAGFELDRSRIGFHNFVDHLGELIADAASQLFDGPGFDPLKALSELAGPVKPSRFFGRLPRRAGLVVALRPAALPKIRFREDHVPMIDELALGDLAGLVATRPEEQNVLTGL